MTRLDEIRVRVTEAQGPDEDWATEFTVLGNHIDLMEHARQDIPDLLRVVEAAWAFLNAEDDYRVLDVYDDSEDVMLASDHLSETRTELRAAIADLDR